MSADLSGQSFDMWPIAYTWGMNKRLITLSFFLLAVVLYFIGMAMPAAIFLLLGMLAEMVFWVRLFRRGGDKPGL